MAPETEVRNNAPENMIKVARLLWIGAIVGALASKLLDILIAEIGTIAFPPEHKWELQLLWTAVSFVGITCAGVYVVGFFCTCLVRLCRLRE